MFRHHTKFHQRGFTLLESMISLVVLSVGMLGIAALYVEGLKASRTAVFRTNAVALAGDMMDRIRANPLGTTNYGLSGADSSCVNGSGNCSPAQMARDDVLVWQAEVADRMPTGASATVAVVLGAPVNPFNTYTILVSWPEAGYSSNLSYTLIADL
jgi:type IV pilus assembly protein PilV